jgi:hypothetical protein
MTAIQQIKFNQLTVPELKKLFSMYGGSNLAQMKDHVQSRYFGKRTTMTKTELEQKIKFIHQLSDSNLMPEMVILTWLNFQLLIKEKNCLRIATQSDWNERDKSILESRKGESVSDNN